MGLHNIKDLLFYEAKPMESNSSKGKAVTKYIGFNATFDKTIKNVSVAYATKGVDVKFKDADLFIPLFCSFDSDSFISAGTIQVLFYDLSKTTFGYKFVCENQKGIHVLKSFDLFIEKIN